MTVTESERTQLALSFRRELRACEMCPLHENTTPVPWSGDLSPTFALMGEAPGRSEAEQGEPFVGRAGHHMRLWLRQAGIDDKAVTFFNSVQCRPPGNRTPEPDELRACKPWVSGTLEFVRPTVLITVGVVAYHQILGREKPKLAVLHGKPLYEPRSGAWWMATYHPAAALRGFVRNGVKYEQIIKDDLARMMTWMENGLPWPLLDSCYVCQNELYRFDENAVGYCEKHAAFQGNLFTEDMPNWWM